MDESFLKGNYLQCYIFYSTIIRDNGEWFGIFIIVSNDLIVNMSFVYLIQCLLLGSRIFKFGFLYIIFVLHLHDTSVFPF